MDRFARGFAFGLMLVATGLAGCGGSGSGLLTGATAASSDAPGALKNDDPKARPIAVAWTSARAHRCGFYFDPAKLRAAYLAYESAQSPPDQLAKAEKTYDAIYKAIRERVAADPNYCSDRKSTEIKKDLTRHLAGDFKPNFPESKQKEDPCGFFGCASTSEKPWDSKKFWEDLGNQNATR
jgi:hypothetical protein